MRSILDVSYSVGGYEECKLDLHLPDKDSFPVFVYFHGGGITAGTRSASNHFNSYLQERGIAVVSVDYRMYPKAKYPDFIEDCAESVAWVKNNIEKYGKCEGIFVGGSSAGGYLSMMLCFDRRWYEKFGISTADIKGYIHDAGQPTAHFNVLAYSGINSKRVIVDETAPLYHIGVEESYPNMLFIVSDNDMQNRYEQTILTVSTLKHFGHEDKTELKVMNGKHCAYVSKMDEAGESVFGKMIYDFIAKQY